jgi:chitin synthase
MVYDTQPWALKDIIYTGIIGFVMIMALIEWLIWLGAFLYSLIKAYQKADQKSIKVLAVLVGFMFTGLRYVLSGIYYHYRGL